MLPFVLGKVAIAATSYKIKKFLTNENNLDKINDALMKGFDWLDSIDHKAERFFDDQILKIDESKDQEKLAQIIDGLDTIKNETTKIIYHNLEELLFHATKNVYTDTFQPCEIKLIRDKKLRSLKYTEENYQQIERFCNILAETNQFLIRYIDEFKTLTQNHSTTQLYKLTPKQIKKLYKLQVFLENIIYLPVSVDNVTISRIAKRSFNKIKHTIELFKS